MADENTETTEQTETTQTTETQSQTSQESTETQQTAEQQGFWPDDWRKRLAGEDEKALAHLDRIKSPDDLWRSNQELRRKLSERHEPATLPDGATEEQIAAYRKSRGVPNEPKGYLENLPDGIVIGDDDKLLVESFLKASYDQHERPETVGRMLKWYYDHQDALLAERAEMDRENKTAGEEELRQEWGPEYRGNMNHMKSFVESALPTDADGNSLSEAFLNARLGDGTILGNNPQIIRWLTKLADDANPAGFIAPAQGMSQLQSVESEIKEIEGLMQKNDPGYWKDEAKQARYRQLLDAQDRLKAKAS